MLTEMAIGDRIDLRFERVVIGSGDGYFADLVASQHNGFLVTCSPSWENS